PAACRQRRGVPLFPKRLGQPRRRLPRRGRPCQGPSPLPESQGPPPDRPEPRPATKTANPRKHRRQIEAAGAVALYWLWSRREEPGGRSLARREPERARDQARGRGPLAEPRAGAPAGADPEPAEATVRSRIRPSRLPVRQQVPRKRNRRALP